MTHGDPWGLFPFPTYARGSLQDGSIHGVHPDCAGCPDRMCLQSPRGKSQELGVCRFGLAHMKVDDERIVLGLVVMDLEGAPKRLMKRVRLETDRRVRGKEILRAVASARAIGPGVVQDFELARAELLRSLRDDPEMQKALAESLRRGFQENLDQSHDFLQLVKLVKGYSEVLLRKRFPDLSPEDAAERLPDEGSIFFATSLMLVKIDSLRFLREVNLALGSETRLRIHPFVTKYARIYKWQADQKQLKIELDGASHGHSRYNNDAVGVVIQGLLDNMVKYAPAGTTTRIQFREDANSVTVLFAGLGPRIEDDERARIFMPGFRARAAQAVESSGLGIGLATAKQVSDALNLRLQVSQAPEPDAVHTSRFETTFSFRLDLCD